MRRCDQRHHLEVQYRYNRQTRPMFGEKKNIFTILFFKIETTFKLIKKIFFFVYICIISEQLDRLAVFVKCTFKCNSFYEV